MVDNKLLPKLSQNLLEILDDEEYYDIIIEVVLRYIYGGKLSLEEYDISDIIKILVAANELGLQELIPYLESFLIENKKNWIEQNINLIYQTSFGNNSFLKLQKYCTNLIIKEPNKIFNSSNFSLIPEKLLITLIQNHKMSEIQVWEHVIKWGHAQNPELSSDPTSFSKDDFNTLKNTLQKCIPFIKFRRLTSKEFLKKVKPYKKILPKELYDDLLEYFLDNDYDPNNRTIKEIKSKNIDSKIITNKHVEIISKWIDRLEINDKLTSSYEFKLLYRDCNDGSWNRLKKFHEVCDNHSQTVTIFKVKDRNEILGGYNPIEWKSDISYGITKDSFIFSFNNDENYILSRVMDETKAINNNNFYGPSFGLDLKLQLLFSDGKISCDKNHYEKPIKVNNDDSFILDFFEVFQLCKTDD
ncbi:carbohydrate-binding module family 13 protein [Rhizophagus irregularis DAOM 181602=DAOM 197198]|nr:carbohydrate-binding module family 13 protein [Rhizophagus irregularis DAOM 181602=DAOM 197198]